MGNQSAESSAPTFRRRSPLIFCPPYVRRSEVHEPSLGFGRRRNQKCQLRLLDGAAGLPQMRLELLPTGLFLQAVLQQARSLMLGIVDFGRVGMALLKELYAAVQIAAMIIYDHAWHAGTLRRLLKSHIHVLASPRPTWHQSDQVHVLMLQAFASQRQILQTNPQDHQTFLRTDLHRVVGQPRPIVRLLQRKAQQAEPQPQQPQSARSPMGDLQGQTEGFRYHCQYSRHPTQRHTCLQHQTEKQTDRADTVAIPAGKLIVA